MIGFETVTDFAANTDEFKRFALAFKLGALASGAAGIPDLLCSPSVFPGTEGQTLLDLLEGASQALGEPVTVFHFHRVAI